MTLTSRYGKVNVYRCVRSNGYIAYIVAWKLGKRRMRKEFTKEEDAVEQAEQVLTLFESGSASLGAYTPKDLFYFEQCQKKLGDVDLMTAVDFYLQMHGLPGAKASPPPAELRDKFLEDLTQRGNSKRDLLTVKTHLRLFCEDFKMPILSIKAADIDRWLQSRTISNRTRNNIRVTLVRLWRFAKQKGHIPRHLETPPELASVYKAERQESPGVFTAKEMADILSVANDAWIPYLTICAFAGLRQAEAMRLTWDDINLEEKVIVLGSHITKTSKRRVAHMPDNLVKWLSQIPDKTGKVCPSGYANDETLRIAKSLGIEWKNNGLRHSYISYQLALTRNAAEVAEQCGNSEAVIQTNYKANALVSGAKKWFGIEPDTEEEGNVLDTQLAGV